MNTQIFYDFGASNVIADWLRFDTNTPVFEFYVHGEKEVVFYVFVKKDIRFSLESKHLKINVEGYNSVVITELEDVGEFKKVSISIHYPSGVFNYVKTFEITLKLVNISHKLARVAEHRVAYLKTHY